MMPNFNLGDRARRNRMSAIVDDEAGADAPASPRPRTGRYDGCMQHREACTIRLDRIVPDPDQPRKEFDPEALDQLAGSLKSRGQLQPIRVRWDEGRGAYVIVVGERRWRAARLAGLESLACVVVAGAPSAAEVRADQLIENALREGLRPLEQAHAFRELMEGLNLTQQGLAAKLNLSQPTVLRALALLELSPTIQSQVESGALAPSVAYEVSKVPDPAAQAELAARVVADGLNRAETIAVVRRSASKPKGRGAAPRPTKPRVFRTVHGKATIEPRKGATVADVLRAALAQAEGQGGETEAA